MSPRKLSGTIACVLALSAASLSPGAEKAGRRGKGSRPQHWAFRAVKRPDIPSVRATAWLRTPIDAFILAALEKNGLCPVESADRRTLLRRLYLDVLGLPPTVREVEAFLKDRSAGAYARVVDDLLARPAYGERWARHWLDVARYAESNGYERDGAKPYAWRYRDYVIAALNADKPYDRFLTEQLAGDEIAGSTAEMQIATTFLRLGTWDDEPADPRVDRYDQLDDVLGTTATAFLGLTLRCARCHDHKFDPFPQSDYYRLLAVFEPLKRPQKDRTELARFVGLEGEVLSYLLPGMAAKEPLRAYTWYEEGPKAPVTRIFRRGDPSRPVKEVSPGLPGVLVRGKLAPPQPLSRSTGRRLWLARWLTRSDNPLVARVMVNRIWQWHFGTGLVATANDFGLMGEEPSHPELLDWLAAEFVAKGWSIKHLHRLILLSNSYRMTSAGSPAGTRADPSGRLLARWRRPRLEAEALRDAVLAVSGRLNPRMRGASIYPPLPRAVLEGQSRPGNGWGKSSSRETARRSIYIFVKRGLAVPELELLDTPDTTCSCEQRLVSTTAPQALTFLNGDFMHEQAGHFAGRLKDEAGPEPAAQVRRAFELAFSRRPRPEEHKAALDFLTAQRRQIEGDMARAKTARGDARRKALEALCLVILNTNEFAYRN